MKVQVKNYVYEPNIEDLKSEKRAMLEDAVSSERSLTKSENRRLAEIDKILNENNENGGKKQMKNENRNQEFLRQLKDEKEIDMSNIEVRAVGSQYAPESGNSRIEVPQNLVAGILMEAQRQNELFNRVHMIQTSQNTKLNVGSYQNEELAKLEEFEEISMKDFQTSHVEVEMERYGTGSRLSRRLIQASNFDVVQHCCLLFGDRLGLTCEKEVLRVLQANDQIQKVGYVADDVYETPLNALVKGLLKLKPVDRSQAVCVCSPEYFEKCVLQQDGNGRNQLSYSLDGVRPSVMGVPVVVSDALENGAYIGNFGRAVVACVNIENIKAVDMPNVHAVDVFLNAYFGVAVQMPEAVVRIEFQA